MFSKRLSVLLAVVLLAGPDRTGFVEANLVQSGNIVTSTQVEFFDLGSASSGWDACYPSDLQTLSATVNGNVISGTVATCNGSATFTGTIAGGTISGTYIPQSGDNAGSSYSFSATQARPLSGTYAGSWGQEIGSPQASVTLTESASGAMTVTGTLSNLGTVSLSGTTVANAIVLQGNANGAALTAMAWVHGHTLWIVNYPDTPSVITLAKQ